MFIFSKKYSSIIYFVSTLFIYNNAFSSDSNFIIYEKGEQINIQAPIRVSEKDIRLIDKEQNDYDTYLMCTDFQNKNGIGVSYFEIYVANKNNNRKIGKILLHSYPEGEYPELFSEFPTLRLFNIKISKEFQKKKHGTQALETLFRKLQKSRTIPKDTQIWGEYNIKESPYMEKILNKFSFRQEERMSDIRFFSANLDSIKFPYYVGKTEDEDDVLKPMKDPSNESMFIEMKRKADNGEASFMYSVGMFYLSIEGDLANNIKLGKFYLMKAAEKGQGLALYHLGLLQLNGSKNTKKNVKNALIYLNKAIDKGETSAMIKVARLYHDGKEVPQDNQKAIELLEKASKIGNSQATRFLKKIQRKLNIDVKKENRHEKEISFSEEETLPVELYLSAIRIEGIKKGEKILLKKANEGDSVATYRLGFLYEKGQKGIKKDLKKALNFYEKTIQIEESFYNPTSKVNFQFLYKSSSGQCYSADAMYRLALLYSSEKKGIKNIEKALGLLESAYKQKLFLENTKDNIFQHMKEKNEGATSFLNQFDKITQRDTISVKKEDILMEINKLKEKLPYEKIWSPLYLNQKEYKILNF